jgi:hypothetical protein
MTDGELMLTCAIGTSLVLAAIILFADRKKNK